jgi:Zn-finger nucleic acid-binding protein
MSGGEQTENIRNNITKEDKARLEYIYSRMTVNQRKEQQVIFLPYAFMLWEKNPPTPEQFELFKNPQKYGVWIDKGRVGNDILENYSNTDFAKVYISRLTRTAKNYGKHDYQVGLYTNEYFKKHNDYFGKDEFMMQFRIRVPEE